jgi:hypothetical protein
MDPGGDYLFATNNEAQDISAYLIIDAGRLRELPGSPISIGHPVQDSVITPLPSSPAP